MYYQELFGAPDTSNMYETEEQRRRRLAAQGQMPAPAPTTKPRPVKETITTDPITGERTVKIEGSERDLSALNTRTPTVTMPSQAIAAPAAPVAPPQPVAQPQPQVTAAPVAPDQFQFQNLTPEQISMMQQRMATMGINDRGMFQGPDAAAAFNARPLAQRQATFVALRDLQGQQPPAAPTAQPAAPAAQPAAPAAQPAAQPAQALGTGITPAAQPDYMALLEGAQTSDRVRNKLLTDPNTPADVRRAAMTLESDVLKRRQQEADLQRRAPELLQNPRTLAAELSRKGEEGSLLKAVLYKSLGMTNLALAEEKKLGAGMKWQSAVSPDGQSQALIRYNAEGLPVAGYSSTGQALNPEQLAQYAAGGMAGNLDIVGGTFVNDITQQVGRVVTDKRTGRSMVQTATGMQPLGPGWRPQTGSGSLDDQRRRLVQELNIRLQGRTEEEKMAITRDYNQQLVGRGIQPVQPYEITLAAPQIAAPGAASMTTPTPAQAGPAVPGAVAPVAPTVPAAAPSAVPGAAPSAAAPAPAPRAPAAAAPGLQATTPALSPVIGGGARPTQPQMEAEAAAAKTQAEALGEDVAKAKINYGKVQEQVATMEELTNQLLSHPGFSVSVGASAQPGFQFVPGTDKATFYALFDQIKGQSFLAAIESMKGLGALSDREGAAATAAVTSLNLNMNERDFRKAAHQLISQMRSYADRNARKAGQPLPYNEPSLADQTRQNNEAQKWLSSARPGGKNANGTEITQAQIDGVRRRLWQRGVID